MTTESNTEIQRRKARDRARKRRAAHPEESRENDRNRYAANPEKARARSRKWRAEHPEKAREVDRRFYAVHLEEVREAKRKRYAAHLEEARERGRKRYAANSESRLASTRKWRAKHPEEVRECARKWKAEHPEEIRNYYRGRRVNDLNFKIASRLRSRLSTALNRSKLLKSAHTLDFLGCSIDEFRVHLESKFQPGMDWTNYGQYGWHIDHIIPIAKFDLTDLDQQRECFHWSNLQPLWAIENMKKGARVVG